MSSVRSRRTRVARVSPHLVSQKGNKPRKAYTGDNPITGAEWKRARDEFGYTQAEFGEIFSTHWNTVARRERDEAEFSHPRLARLAIQQHREDRINRRKIKPDHTPIKGAEWRLYIEALGMTPEKFGEEIDAHPSTIGKWLKDEVEFQHPSMARLAIRRLYKLKGIFF